MMTITATKETMYALARMFLEPEVPEIGKTHFVEYEGGESFGIGFTSSINHKHEYFIYLAACVGTATAIIRERRYADDGKRSSSQQFELLSIAQLRKLNMLRETADLRKA